MTTYDIPSLMDTLKQNYMDYIDVDVIPREDGLKLVVTGAYCEDFKNPWALLSTKVDENNSREDLLKAYIKKEIQNSGMTLTEKVIVRLNMRSKTWKVLSDD